MTAKEKLDQIEALLEGAEIADGSIVEKVEGLLNIRRNVNAADVVILLGNKGQSGSARFKGMSNRIPFTVDVHYGEDDDPPLTIRQVTVRAGFKRSEWRKMDRSALHEGADSDG